MTTRRRYRKRNNKPVVALRLELQTDGFSYSRRGGVQRCKAGDWIVNNDGDVYTIDSESFAQTYQRQSPGVYLKTTIVEAERTDAAGVIETRNGVTNYEKGDYLVWNNKNDTDCYAVAPERFEDMYEEVSAE